MVLIAKNIGTYVCLKNLSYSRGKFIFLKEGAPLLRELGPFPKESCHCSPRKFFLFLVKVIFQGTSFIP